MDCFALLDEQRRPWIDLEALKSRFLRSSAEVHPDRFHGASEPERVAAQHRYTDLNTAYLTLREPRSRLLHLLELEAGQRPADIQRIPPGTMDIFVAVGEACRSVDAFLAERQAVQSPMLKVRLFQQGLDWTDRLKSLQQRVQQQATALDEELRTLNQAWLSAAAVGSPERVAGLPLGRLEEIYRVLSYVSRWTGQIQERLAQLAVG
jgi:DnaJ-domain-containing protein 1